MSEPANSQYDLITRWQFNAPIDAVWEAIMDAEGWPAWWTGVERVDTLTRGDINGVGARRRYVCKSVLPFRLSFVTRVTRVEPLCLIEGRVEGELEGVGCCYLGRDGGLTTVRYEWHVRTTRPWMNALAPLLKPLFRWNHDAIMRAGGIGLSRHLGTSAGAEIARPS